MFHTYISSLNNYQNVKFQQPWLEVIIPVCITLKLTSCRCQNDVLTVPVHLGDVVAAAEIVGRKQPIFSDRRDCFPIPRCGYALRVAVMNGIAGLDPCDYLGQSARETFKHELWDKRGEMLFLADWTATSVICLTWLSWKTGSWTCKAFVTMIISGHNYHISNATISWQWHCVINYVEAVKFIPLFLVKKSVEVSGKWQLHSTWHYVLSRWLVKYRQVFLCRFLRKTWNNWQTNKKKNTHSFAVFQLLVNSFPHFGHCIIILSAISILI